jgi:uncharacterized membrane protein (UPF0127 family)
MTSIRKYAAYFLIGAFGIFIFSSVFNSCQSGGSSKPAVQTKGGSGTYEPKFRKDGDLWVFSAASGDTLSHFEVEYANTAERIEYGMMYRKSMDETTGMLFFMGDMQMRSFWMKNTYVSLDIIFIDDQMKIVSIQKNAEPLNTRSLPSEGPAMYVLELKGGVCDALGIGKGDKIQFRDIEAVI